MEGHRKESNPPEKMSGLLPAGVIVDILKRLSVKDLVRFNSVSKPWYSLINSKYFISLHTQHAIATENHLLLVRAYTHNTRKENYSLHVDNDGFAQVKLFDFPFKSKYAYFKVVGCVNGVVCLSDDFIDLGMLMESGSLTGNFDCTPTMVLWNPSIMKSVTLPSPNCLETNHENIGFGFDSAKNDYKVVRVCLGYETDEEDEEIIEVYELSTGSWRILDSNGFPDYVDENSPAVYLNGAVHWMGKSYEMIVSFDIASEVCDGMEVPQSLVGELSNMSSRIADIGGTLSIIHSSFKDGKYSVWAMEQYGDPESWTQRFSFDSTPSLQGGFGFLKNGDIVLLETTGSNHEGFEDTKLVSYSPQSEQVKDLGVIGSRNGYYVDRFVETLELLSIKGTSSAKQAKIDVESTKSEPEDLAEKEMKSTKHSKTEAKSSADERTKADEERKSAKHAKIEGETEPEDGADEEEKYAKHAKCL